MDDCVTLISIFHGSLGKNRWNASTPKPAAWRTYTRVYESRGNLRKPREPTSTGERREIDELPSA
jgi:hypothetical protein